MQAAAAATPNAANRQDRAARPSGRARPDGRTRVNVGTAVSTPSRCITRSVASVVVVQDVFFAHRGRLQATNINRLHVTIAKAGIEELIVAAQGPAAAVAAVAPILAGVRGAADGDAEVPVHAP